MTFGPSTKMPSITNLVPQEHRLPAKNLMQPPQQDECGDLRGVLDRERAEIGVLLSMEEPTGPMRREAASAGFYRSRGWNRNYPRLQLLTVSELLQGKSLDMPPQGHTNVTFKKAPRARTIGAKQETIPFDKEEE